MKAASLVAVIVLVVGAGSVPGGGSASATPPAERSEGVWVWFEPNLGQAPEGVAFTARAGAYTFFLTPQEAVFVLPGAVRDPGPVATLPAPHAGSTLGPGEVVRMRFLDANPEPLLRGEGRTAAVSNYIRGEDPAGWVSGVPHYRSVVAREVWPGVDAVFYGEPGDAVRYDLVVGPGADPSAIRLGFEGASVWIDGDGALLLHSRNGPIVRKPPPFTYQGSSPGDLTEVASRYVLNGDGTVGFRIGSHDPAEPVVIDPIVLAYSTFVGGSSFDRAEGIAVGADGSAYVAGTTTTVPFPPAGVSGPIPQEASDVFVAKLTPAGDALAWSTYLGGSSDDGDAWGVAVGPAGDRVVVAGTTASPDFPTLNPAQGTFGGERDAFIATLDPDDGTLVWSTYLGGSGEDDAWGVAVGPDGSAYVAGETTSPDFPTRNALQPTSADGSRSGFLTRLTPEGDALAWSTYLGGSRADTIGAIAVDATGSPTVAGGTFSPDFPTTNAFQPNRPSAGPWWVSGFVTRFTPDGQSLLYSTYLGGSLDDHAWGIAVDAGGNTYVTGFTRSEDFPMHNPFQGEKDTPLPSVFVTALDAGGDALLWSTYLDPNGELGAGFAIAVDSDGRVAVTGITRSLTFPTHRPYQAHNSGYWWSAFVTTFTPDGDTLDWSTYLGGAGDSDSGTGVAMDDAGAVYVTGPTTSPDFPTTLTSYRPFAPPPFAVPTRIPPDSPWAEGFVAKFEERTTPMLVPRVCIHGVPPHLFFTPVCAGGFA